MYSQNSVEEANKIVAIKSHFEKLYSQTCGSYSNEKNMFAWLLLNLKCVGVILTIFVTLICLSMAASLISLLIMFRVSLLNLIITSSEVRIMIMRGRKKPNVKRKML